MTKLKNIHPGEVLFEEFLLPFKISQNQLAREISVPPRRINEIIHGNRSVTADTSIRLAKYFNLSDNFFLGIQKDYDLEEARKKLGGKVNNIKPILN